MTTAHHRHWIDGRPRPGTSGRTAPGVQPGDRRADRRGRPRRRAAEVDAAVAQRRRRPPRVAHALAVAARRRCCSPSASCCTTHADELAAIITAEHGKVLSDAAGEIARGLENVEFACGVPQLLKGGYSRAGRDRRRRLLASASRSASSPASRRSTSRRWCRCGCAPTRSPAATRSCSSRARRTRRRRCSSPSCWQEAGLPDGVFTVVQGDKEAVDALLDHPDIAAVSFVGSTPIAQYIYETRHRARQAGAGARRREEPHARAARRRPRHGRRRRGVRRLRRGRRAVHGDLGRGRGRRRRRPARRRDRRPAAEARASATAPTRTPRWAR